jgi:hypothetical protein
MAVLCKYPALVLIPILLLLELWEYFRGERPKTGRKANRLATVVGRWAWGSAGFALSVFLLFLPATIHLRDHLGPFSYFIEAIKDVTRHAQNPYPSFFLGRFSNQRYWSYFPMVFLLKSTLPLSVLLILGAVLALYKKIKIGPWQWVPPLLVLLSMLRVLNVGVRYLLPAYPFVILMAAGAATWIWEHPGPFQGRRLKGLAAGLLVWNCVSVLAQFPHHISYFNDLITPDKKIYWLGDSNLDFNQDLKRLAAQAECRGWISVKLAYGGSYDPSIYGLKWQRWTRKDLEGPQPGNVYAVNAGFLQVTPAFFPEVLPIAGSWITQTPPTGKIADTWYYFEMPGVAPKDKSPLLPSVPVLKMQ